MDRLPLLPHPAMPPTADWRLRAGAAIGCGRLQLAFRLEGDTGRLRLPSGGRRRDGLWQHTCFEAFLRPGDDDAYFEFNFTPAGAWAAYAFSARRRGMTPLQLPAPPAVEWLQRGDCLEVATSFPLPRDAARGGDAALCAVLEDLEGGPSYWALAHPGPQPDFHDPAGFTLALADR